MYWLYGNEEDVLVESKVPIVALVYLLLYRGIGLTSRVFANGPRDQGSIPSRVIPDSKKGT